ncbi:MAG: HAD-IIA family hydrolase [Gordonia sp. (in: high G+C Gram-positive bacteria)]|uniref:HAD-IIA family hydrolase n=1 Tax=Gordonia sp. (in: high G+C Gram-positive bacteria) TaxID=84139 RepID=UPI0039E2AE3E
MSKRGPQNGSGDESSPQIPDDVRAGDLDPDVRRELQSLDKQTADRVARHLVVAGDVLADDPELALEHARAARARAARVGVVRETNGIAAYYAGEWQEAISELRAARRISGEGGALLPLIADSERGLGRPERAIEIADGDEGRALHGDDAVELAIVASGAHIDLGEPEAAVDRLGRQDLRVGRTGTEAARLFSAYAGALLAAGRRADALTWYQNAAAADVDDVTDAEYMVQDLLAETDGATTTVPEPVTASTEPAGADLLSGYDALLLDLDGTLFEGASALPGAIDLVTGAGERAYFVTNNASRSPAEVAAHLTELGFTATDTQVITSAQVGAELLAQRIPSGAKVLVVGAQALRDEVTAAGLSVVDSADDRPAAVIQGHSPATGWAQLSEAALAIRAGALWVATNTDTTLPSERGLLVGNGSMVAAVATATASEPVVAGKPAAPIMREALSRSGSSRPLMIGDRLDTDIAGADTVGIESLLVLTGVTTPRTLLAAGPAERPTYIVGGLDDLSRPADVLRVASQPRWQVTVNDNRVSVEPKGAPQTESLLPALAHAVWTADVGGLDLRIGSPDPATVGLLDALGLSPRP